MTNNIYDNEIIPMIRQFEPSMIAMESGSIQPMIAPSGILYNNALIDSSISITYYEIDLEHSPIFDSMNLKFLKKLQDLVDSCALRDNKNNSIFLSTNYGILYNYRIWLKYFYDLELFMEEYNIQTYKTVEVEVYEYKEKTVINPATFEPTIIKSSNNGSIIYICECGGKRLQYPRHYNYIRVCPDYIRVCPEKNTRNTQNHKWLRIKESPIVDISGN